MEKYLNHYSAANFWKIPCLEVAAKNLLEETGENKHFTFTNRKRISHKKGRSRCITRACFPPTSGSV